MSLPALGRVFWTDAEGTERVAILRTDGTWDDPLEPEFGSALTAVYADWPRGPEYGYYGPEVIRDLATQLGGVAHIELIPVGNPGVVH